VGLSRIRVTTCAAVLLGAAAAQAQSDLNACVAFPGRQLTDIDRRADRTTVAWRGSARNSCQRALTVEARFSLAAPDGSTLAAHDAKFQLAPGETIELRGDFALPPGTRAHRLGSMNVTYVAR